MAGGRATLNLNPKGSKRFRVLESRATLCCRPEDVEHAGLLSPLRAERDAE